MFKCNDSENQTMRIFIVPFSDVELEDLKQDAMKR